MANTFEIGTTISTTLLASLTYPIPEPSYTFEAWTEETQMQDGTIRGDGQIRASWSWTYLTYNQYAQLRVYCPGKSVRDIYIRTMCENNTFRYYKGVMSVKTGRQIVVDRVLDIEVVFNYLEDVTPA